MHPYAQDGAGFIMEIHLDIGNDGLTKEFILDMTAKIQAMGLTAKLSQMLMRRLVMQIDIRNKNNLYISFTKTEYYIY